MYQRVLVTLFALFIAGTSFGQSILNSGDPVLIYNPGAPLGTPTNPAGALVNDNLIYKWIYSPTLKYGFDRLPTNWDKSKFKCYKVNNMDFRLRFPNNYDSTNPGKYPVVIFWHGGGEIGAIQENQDQLYWGAQLYEQRINAGEWNGFLLFPQESKIGFDTSHFRNVNIILDSIQKSCAADLDRVIHMGLSEGGGASVHYGIFYPQRIAGMVPSDPIDVSTYITSQGGTTNDLLNKYLQIPIYVGNGGLDGGPNPLEAMSFLYNVGGAGGNIYQSYYYNYGHSAWSPQWVQKDFYNNYILSTFWNTAHKAQPLVYYNKTSYCTGDAISTKLGITAGYLSYQWQMDNGSGFTPIVGANSNTYTATQTGRYIVRFQHADGTWSVWTPNPVAISTHACSVDTVFKESFEQYPVLYYASTNYKDLENGSPCPGATSGSPQINQNGFFPTGTLVFTHDARGVQGGRFMLNATAATSCTYGVNDQVWGTYQPITVAPNTTYTLSFYLGNESVQAKNFSPVSPLAKIIPDVIDNNYQHLVTSSGVSTTGVGDLSWKKFSFNFTTGPYTTSVNLALLNATATSGTSGTGNDFAIDEISVSKASPVPAPGGVATNLQLWSRAGTINGADNSAVQLWNNDDLNSNSLVQSVSGNEPKLRNTAANFINFNPIVSYTSGTNQAMFVNQGFAGTAAHTAAHAFVMMKSAITTENKNIFLETQASSKSITLAVQNGGNIVWTAGTAGTNSVTATGVNETSRPVLWSFSKDDVNGTGSGFKQDIRKNGVLMGSNNTVGGFTGNNSNFLIGANQALPQTSFGANIAEVVYYLDANINAGTQNKIESYLALKYGTTLGFKAAPQNYRASDSTIFWNASSGYQVDVFGIGTDSTSGLIQTKSNSVNSGSGDGTGQPAKGNLVLVTNTSLMDKQFLMIGHDSTSLTQRPITNIEAPFVLQGAIRLTRTWLVNNTGAVGPVDLSFDSTGLSELSGGAILSNYALLIDSDGDGNYNTGTATVYYATSAAGKKILFSGVTLPNNVTFTILTVRSPNSTLPATWLGFNVVAKNDNAQLTWQTSEEINVDHYSVEHSLTGGSYVAVGARTANNSTGINTYSFTHGPLSTGVHYYRIRRVDKDGVSEFSVVKTVNITSTGANMEVRPNPVVGSNLLLAISTQQNAKADIHIMSVDGKTILQQSTNLQQGMNTINMNVANVPSGIYLVQLVLNGELVTKKFIRQR
jgi:hypothetical protein